MVSSSKCAMDDTIQRIDPLFIIMSKFVTSHHKQLIIVEIKCFQFCLYHGSKHPRKICTLHSNFQIYHITNHSQKLIENHSKICVYHLVNKSKILRILHSNFQNYHFTNNSKKIKNKAVKCCNVLIIKWFLPISVLVIHNCVL